MTRHYCMTGADGQVHESSHRDGIHGDGRVCHPVVVICPENREQVERLLSAYHAQYPMRWESDLDAKHADNLQTALRSLITPPKPDEPQGLGAVVEDAEGMTWVRYRPADSFGLHWTSSGNGASGRWSDIDAVRVLSEGVR